MFFYPKTIESRKSKINGEVRVVKLLGSYRLVVGKYTQSGGLVKEIWKKALSKVKKNIETKNPKILILGLGAGNAAEISNKNWPEAEISGIELDKTMIELGKKYFSLSEILNLTIFQTDAISWVDKKVKAKNKFDLIIVDLYIGSDPPKAALAEKFLKNVKGLLSPTGFALFNRLIIKEKRQQTKDFKIKLEKVFPKVKTVPTPANLVYFVSN